MLPWFAPLLLAILRYAVLSTPSEPVNEVLMGPDVCFFGPLLTYGPRMLLTLALRASASVCAGPFLGTV